MLLNKDIKRTLRKMLKIVSRETKFCYLRNTLNKKNTSFIGTLGEDIAVRYLKEKGYSVLGRNYREKWGEIDVVTQREGRFHFFEVKAVEDRGQVVMPEENVHEKKLKRLFRTIHTYLESIRAEEKEWQLDVLAIFIDRATKTARIRLTPNVFLE